MKTILFHCVLIFTILADTIFARTPKSESTVNDTDKPKVVQKRLDGAVIEHHGNSFEGFHHHGDEKGYSAGSGLRSIAQGSAHQAHSAVSNQQAAGVQASYIAKNTLAQAAIQAAATAHAALAGKEVLLQELEHQSVVAHHILEAEAAQLHLSERSAASAKQVAQQAASHVAILSSALNNAQAVSELSEQSAHQAAQELASQSAMVGKAKARLHEIKEHLKAAHIDYEATKIAAEKAASAAHEAQHNAQAAAAHAHVQLTETAIKKSGGESSSGGGEAINHQSHF